MSAHFDSYAPIGLGVAAVAMALGLSIAERKLQEG